MLGGEPSVVFSPTAIAAAVSVKVEANGTPVTALLVLPLGPARLSSAKLAAGVRGGSLRLRTSDGDAEAEAVGRETLNVAGVDP